MKDLMAQIEQDYQDLKERLDQLSQAEKDQVAQAINDDPSQLISWTEHGKALSVYVAASFNQSALITQDAIHQTALINLCVIILAYWCVF